MLTVFNKNDDMILSEVGCKYFEKAPKNITIMKQNIYK